MRRSSLRLLLLGVALALGLPGGVMAAPGWVNPKPPYPMAALMRREQGVIILRVATDAAGRVVKATASVPTRQTDTMPNVAQCCVDYALHNWHGPPNAKGKMVMEFVLH